MYKCLYVCVSDGAKRKREREEERERKREKERKRERERESECTIEASKITLNQFTLRLV